ncbi:MAG: hypothetical protein CFE26_15225, partial [Verrucomicrobiales bacterium VVV1]
GSTLNAGITLGTFNLGTLGILNGVATPLVIGGRGGAVTVPTTTADNLYVNAGAGAIVIDAPINNNTGALTLVKNGSNTLTLRSTTSTYSGGTVINAGTVSVTANTQLGAAGTAITFNGNGTLSSNIDTTLVDLGARAITLNSGAIATFTSVSRGNMTIGGEVSGSGGVTLTSGTFWSKYRFDSTANTFSGAITDSRSSTDVIANALLSFNSISNVAGAGNIILNGAADNGIDYGSGAIAPLVMDYRQLVLANNNTVFFNNASSQAVNINTDIAFSGTGARQIRFGITGRSGAGVSTFAGKLTDNAGGAFSPNFNGGTWVVSGNNNSYTGTTSVSGTANVTMSGNNALIGQITISGNSGATLTLNGNNSGMSSPVLLNTSFPTSAGASPLLNINSATALGTGTLSFGGGAASDTGRIDNTSAGAVNVSTANAITMNRNFTFVGTRDLNLGTGTTTLGGMTSGTNRSITVAANTLTLGGTIAEAVSNLGITKAGLGTLVLSGSNSYTGPTTVSAGTLQIDTAAALPSGSQISLPKSGTNTGTLRLNTSGTNVYTNTFANFSSSNGLANGGTPNIQNVQGNNTLSGNMTLAAGGGNGVNIQSDAGLLTISGNLTTTSGATGNRPFSFGGAGNGVISGVMSQAGGADIASIVKSGAGTWSVTGTTSSFTGGVTVLDGVLNVASVAVTGTNSSIGAGGPINLTGQGTNGTLQYTGSTAVTTNRALTVAATGGTLDASGTGSGTLKFTGSFTASSPSGTNLNYTNGSNVATNLSSVTPGTVGGGVMTVAATGLAPGTTITSISGNSYTLSNPFTGATAAVASTFTDNVARTLTLTGSNAGANEISSNMGNSAGGGVLSISKTGAGSWVLSGTNTYTGSTTVSAGTLALGANDVLPNASAVSIGTATLNAATFTDTVGTLDATAAAVINLGTGGALAFANSSAVDWTGGTLNITGTYTPTSIRFGTTSGGLTSGQLAVISVNGSGAGTYTLAADGYLVSG